MLIHVRLLLKISRAFRPLLHIDEVGKGEKQGGGRRSINLDMMASLRLGIVPNTRGTGFL